MASPSSTAANPQHKTGQPTPVAPSPLLPEQLDRRAVGKRLCWNGRRDAQTQRGLANATAPVLRKCQTGRT